MADTLLLLLEDLASQGHLSKAFRTFSRIQRHAPPCGITLQSLSSLLPCCTYLKSLPQGRQLHSLMARSGVERHPMLVPKLITFYTSLDLLPDAHLVTETSKVVHSLPWNLLISSYVRAGRCKQALSAYKQMLGEGIRADSFTYPSVLKACGEELNLWFGKAVHGSIGDGCRDLYVLNAVISMYGKCGEVDVARMLFGKLPERDSISWNTMVSIYADKGMWNEAFDVFGSMQREGVDVDTITWNTIAKGHIKSGNFKGALGLLSHMRNTGVPLDYVAVITGLGACSHLALLKLGKEIHGLAIRCLFNEFDNVKNALITLYSRCRDLYHAQLVFDLMEARNVITWNSIISGYTHWDQSEQASFLFREMMVSGVEPNYVTIASVLPLCARVANLQHGKEFHCYITRREGFRNYLLLWNSLVDMYARSGKIIVAKRLFDSLSNKDTVTYTSLIAGYGIQGEGQTAFTLFEKMTTLNIIPDHITMVAVLAACSHAGLVKQGETLFRKMSSEFGIAPRLEHFACMVDLYGRAGLLVKAKEVIMKMPFRLTPAIWATILGASQVHGNTEIGEWAAEKLLEMKPRNSGYYVLIANLYAAVGCWHKLAIVRVLMKDFGVEKAPGRAWVDVGTGFSSFVAGDVSNMKADGIYTLLGGMTKQLKEAGYVMGDNALEDGAREEKDEEDF